MNTWPDDTLLIQYSDLGLSPDERLDVLSLIGTLLNKSVGSYTPTMLGINPSEGVSLRAWIGQGGGEQFWHLESERIRIIRVCEKHILLGTSQLLTDLRSQTRKLARSHQFLDKVWMVAQSYVDLDIVKGSEVTND